MPSYDTIIIGAGHNGMVCACYLARRGQKVLLLEAANEIGGLAAKREFFPEFQVPVAHSISHFSAKVVKELNLESHGFINPSFALPTVGLNRNGEHVVLAHDEGGAASLSGVSEKDLASFKNYQTLMYRYAAMLKPFWETVLPRIGVGGIAKAMTYAKLGLKLRLLGKSDMREFMRIAMLPARDLMDEYFDNDLLKALLSWDALIGSKMAPRSPNGPVVSLLYRMGGDFEGAHYLPENGIESLIYSLRSVAEASGVEIRTNAPVEKILIQGNESGLKVEGVKMPDGEIITATRVVSSADPHRTFVDLVGVENLEIQFANRIRRLRSEGYVAKLHLALHGEPKFTGLAGPEGRMIIAPSMDTIEFAYDDAKYGEFSRQPVMEVLVPTRYQSELAPPGKHVISAHVMYIPKKLKSKWCVDAREEIKNKTIDLLSQYSPGLKDLIVHAEFLTPEDIESNFRITGGNWHHADHVIDQMFMMRPTYEAAQYSTPVPGLFLCGAGCHPGGDLTGAAGHNAAHEILKP
ncbi:NAD(P)/FAD-dependent oxidoreductase [Gammaproteobacteria bacterium]|nr:NAD(P)/FAD-dependent oxidoreductase [Gammaproteobacteria bacterium]